MKPLISFIGPGHRTERFKKFCDGIKTNLPYEVIFVTDKYPTSQDLEGCKNLRWIFSNVKPAQCFELAYRASLGDFIIWTGDDFTYPDYALDKVYAMYQSLNDHRKMISFKIHQDKEYCHHFLHWRPDITMTTSALISKKAIDEAGGLADIRFPCGHWDCDLMLRIRALGGEVIECDGANAFEEHHSLHLIEYNFGTTWASEWEDFKKLWNMGGELKRQEPFVGYQEKDILYKNQGPAGKWKEREMNGTVSIILPTIRKHLLGRALDTISRAWTLLPEIIIVADYDNPGGLGTNVKFIKEERQGVIHAINTGFKHATGEYIFLTNDDSTMVPQSINEMVKFSKENNDEALIGIKVNPSGSVHRYWGRYFAAWIFVHRNLLAKINETTEWFLDPAFHAFYADPDLSMRAYAKGVPVIECPNALIIADMIPASDDIDNTQKEIFYKRDQGVFIERHRHLGKFHDGDSELQNVGHLI